MTLRERYSRRMFLRITSAGAASIAVAGLLAACADEDDDPGVDPDPVTDDSEDSDEPDDEDPEAEEPEPESPIVIGDLEGPTIVTDESRWPTSFNEAPDLAERVAAGELPPVEERIGEDPLVIEPLHEIGQYGGTWRRGFTGPGDRLNGNRVAAMDWVLGFHYDGQQIVPAIAKEWEYSDDGQEFTLHLRRGMHWSDGEPFTADDFMFWYEDMFGNDELVPVKPREMLVGGEFGTLERVDDYTVTFRFAAPNFMMPLRMARGPLSGASANNFNGHGAFAPAHYLRQFHIDHADPDELDAAIADAGVDDWIALFRLRADWALNPDVPVVTPWKVRTPLNSPTFSFERNPYSIWVDTEGNQLPYIDEIVMTLAEDLEVINLRAIAGEYDFQARHIDMSKLPVILENREEGDYSVYFDTGDYGSDMAFMPNQSYDGDEEIAQWLSNVDFRRALSLGINRDQVNETFWLGLGTPGSPAPSEDNKYSPGPEYRTLWHEHDPERANQLLDDLGLTEKDGDGFRLRADGAGQLQIEIVSVGAQFIPYTQITEMIAEQYREIGIRLLIREVERSLWSTIMAGNEHQITTWNNDGSENALLDPRPFFPVSGSDYIGPLYGQWYASNGQEGLEPPAELREAMEAYQNALTGTEDEQVEIISQLWRNTLEQVNYIGIVGLSPAAMGVRIVKNNMGNIPARQYNSPIVRNPVPSCPPTFFFKS